MQNWNVLEVKGVRKAFTGHLAVDRVTLSVPAQCIFGLLGPNGAGKTTLIRMITGITMADEGEIILNGKPINGVLHTNIGYLPEERGLYKKMKVAEQLVYLGQLKGLSQKQAMDRTRDWLERFDMMDWRKRKVEELSKGMQQKIQFISTILHDPDLIILDEPFTGLDPVNTNLIKSEIERMRDQGKSIIFSTHRMEQVEEICERIALINQGNNVLDGEVWRIKDQFKDHKYTLKLTEEISNNIQSKYDVQSIPVRSHDHFLQYWVYLDSQDKVASFLNDVVSNGGSIVAFSEILPSLNEVFIKIVSSDDK